MNAPLEPRDLLVHLREWLSRHWKTNAKHFGESDESGHPHGYTGVVIPDWDLRQRLDEIEACIALKQPRTQWQPIETAPKDGTPIIVWGPGRDNAWVAYWQPEGRLNLGRKPAFVDGSTNNCEELYLIEELTHWQVLPEPPEASRG